MPPVVKNITTNFIKIQINQSSSKRDIRKAVINLYKAWYRQLPIIMYDYNIDITPEDARSKLREIYMRNSRLEDPKLISALVMKGQMELNETVNKQKEDYHVWKYFRNGPEKPKDFLSKFLEGQ